MTMVSKSKKRYRRIYKRPRSQVAREKREKEKKNGQRPQDEDSGSSESESEGELREYVPMESSTRKRSLDDAAADGDGYGPTEGRESEGLEDRPREAVKRSRTDDWNDDNTLVRPEGGFRNKDGRKIKKPKSKEYPEIVPNSHDLKGWVKNNDLQHLALYILAEGPIPQWTQIKNRSAIRKVVVLFVPGLSLDLFDGRTRLLSPPPKDTNGTDTQEGKGRSAVKSDNMDIEEPVPTATKSEGNYDTELKETEVYDDPNAGVWTYVAKHDFTPIPLKSLPYSTARKQMEKMFTHIVPTRAGGDNNKIFSPVQNMLKVPLPQKQRDYRKQKQKPKLKNERLKISALFLNPMEMLEDNYPVHSSISKLLEEPDAWAAASTERDWLETDMSQEDETTTAHSGDFLEGRQVLAVDCEMVKSATGSVLARVSIVDWDGKAVFDTLVKPEVDVVDYVTQFSGITEEMLKDVTTTLKDVHSKLQELVTPSTVLVGHSLNTDLHVLRYAHPNIVDTSVIYDCPRGKPFKPSLKWLANKYLKMEIQKNGVNGHDSIEDATACLKLLKMKMEGGRDFGTQSATEETIFDRLGKVKATGGVVDYGNPAAGHGYKARVSICCASDAEVCAGVGKCVNGEIQSGTVPVDFAWGRLVKLEQARNWKSNWQKFTDEVYRSNMTADSPPIEIPALPPPPTTEVLSEAVHDTISKISSIYESLPKCTAFIVYSGTGDPQEMARLNAMQQVHRKEYTVKKWDQLSVKWTDDEEQALKKAVNVARKGIAFITVK